MVKLTLLCQLMAISIMVLGSNAAKSSKATPSPTIAPTYISESRSKSKSSSEEDTYAPTEEPTLAPTEEKDTEEPTAKPTKKPSGSKEIFGKVDESNYISVYDKKEESGSEEEDATGESETNGKLEKPQIFNDYYVETFKETSILSAGESFKLGEYASSPSGKFRVGLSLGGDLVLEWKYITDQNQTFYINLWNAGVEGGTRVFLQHDGNLKVYNQTRQTLWKSGTHKHDNATLIVDDGGRIGMRYKGTLIWMEGLPQRTYRGPSSEDLRLPARGTFYYAWYPQTWKSENGTLARFIPDAGLYVSGDPMVIDSHIDQLEYGNIDVGIISWFGPGTNLDIARITNLMDRSLEKNAIIKWTLYYEDEYTLDPDIAQLQADLYYIKKWFAWHPTYAHVDGKPLIYVWNEKDCDVVDRWMNATDGEWFVVPKLFGGYSDCPVQPNNWHQYGPASPYQRFEGHSVSISPGFWHANKNVSRLPRLNQTEWCDNINKMVQTREPWQLITTFNEALEGTGIESSAVNWPSESGYGIYLDCLHNTSTKLLSNFILPQSTMKHNTSTHLLSNFKLPQSTMRLIKSEGKDNN